jgi:hypothetical protein
MQASKHQGYISDFKIIRLKTRIITSGNISWCQQLLQIDNHNIITMVQYIIYATTLSFYINISRFPNSLCVYPLSYNSSLNIRWACKIWGSHNGGYEHFCLMGDNAVQSVESQPTFRRNMSPPSSSSFCLLHVGFLHGLFFSHEDGSDMFLWNVGRLSTDYIALYCRR